MQRPLILASLLLCASAHAAPDRPEQTAQAFYRWVLAHPNVSLPSAAQRKELEPLLAPRFLSLLATAAQGEQRCVAITPRGRKPPIYEGSLFVGNYEGATKAAYRVPARQGQGFVIDVDLSYNVPPRLKGRKLPPLVWRDRVKLEQHGRRWRVADVVMEERSLANALQQYVDEVIPDCLRKYRPARARVRS